MKKLMFLAVVASATVASAVTCVTTTVKAKDPYTGEVIKTTVTGAATAHKVAITLKTTGWKNGKPSTCSSCNVYREQKTVKINGLIWEQLLAPAEDQADQCPNECVPFGSKSFFWTKDAVIDAEFAMGVGLIGKADKNGMSKKIQAYGGLGSLVWAGFGTLTSKDTSKCGDCLAYVKSISGGIAGQLEDPADTSCCDVIAYEGCCDDMQLANSAAYGTIKITYDAATAKKIAIAEDADDVASFVKLPAAALVDDEGEKIDPADYVGDVTIED